MAGSVSALGDGLAGALPTAMTVGGLALMACAAYLHYVALPEEQSRRHMMIRGALAAAGIVLLLVGIASM